MWSSWVKENGTTQVMYIAKLKVVQKELKRFSKWYDRGGENGII
jgi:hypothetical protein